MTANKRRLMKELEDELERSKTAEQLNFWKKNALNKEIEELRAKIESVPLLIPSICVSKL